MKLERALACAGWMSEAELAYIAGLAPRSKIVVELGSWRGRSAIAWAENGAKVVYCVDTWDDSAFGCENFPGDAPDLKQRPEWLWNEFLRNTVGLPNIFPLRMTTAEAAGFLAPLGIKADVVFIDAGHLAHEVVADIEAWRPLLRDENSVLCGHDYNFSGWPDVKTVVDQMIPKFSVIGTIWTTEGV
jgi:hypothetical protein